MNVMRQIHDRQLPALAAIRVSVARQLGNRTNVWICLGYGLCYGILVAAMNRREFPGNLTRGLVFSFSVSILFSAFITYTGGAPWRMRLVPSRFSTVSSMLIVNGLLTLLFGYLGFVSSMLLASLVASGPAKTMTELHSYLIAGAWGLVYVPVSISLALGEVYALRSRRSLARQARFARMAEEARAVALRAQINPHFFFNALNTIAALIPERPDQAERAVELLAESLRPVLTRDQPLLATVASEFVVARAYAQIEQLRHGERLSIDFDLDSAAEAVLVPSLSLQPLLENAITHGASRTPQPFRIQVVARRDAESTVLEIIAAPSDAFGETREMTRIESEQGHAIDNISLRTRALFGGAACVEVSTGEGLHSFATMRIPTSGPVKSAHAVAHAHAHSLAPLEPEKLVRQ